MSRRIDAAVAMTRDFETRACQSEPRCVNRKCDGTRHFATDGTRWGDGWDRKVTR
jgi:hypothetical protein